MWLKEQFIHGLKDNDMLTEIIHELTTVRDTSMITSDQVLAWAMQVKAWWSQTAVLDSLKETKDFDTIKSGRVE